MILALMYHSLHLLQDHLEHHLRSSALTTHPQQLQRRQHLPTLFHRQKLQNPERFQYQNFQQHLLHR
jgi:hypothetical protein